LLRSEHSAATASVCRVCAALCCSLCLWGGWCAWPCLCLALEQRARAISQGSPKRRPAGPTARPLISLESHIRQLQCITAAYCGSPVLSVLTCALNPTHTMSPFILAMVSCVSLTTGTTVFLGQHITSEPLHYGSVVQPTPVAGLDAAAFQATPHILTTDGLGGACHAHSPGLILHPAPLCVKGLELPARLDCLPAVCLAPDCTASNDGNIPAQPRAWGK
jgi:hypothetical protein